MKQWEIYSFPFPAAEQPHPFVIFSVDEIAANPDYFEVNALKCVSVRGDYKLKKSDVWLDSSEGPRRADRGPLSCDLSAREGEICRRTARSRDGAAAARNR